MKKIFIKDVINTSNAIIQKFGLAVFDEVKSHMDSDRGVILSFEGLTNVTSGFCHASIGNIYKAFPDKVAKLLKIEGAEGNPVWQEKINDSITLAINPKMSEEFDSAIAELFI